MAPDLSAELFAHSLPGRPQNEWERLGAHAPAVARCAGKFAAAFGFGRLAEILGLLHDAGKAAPEFQEYIRGLRSKGGDHSTWGARIAAERYGPLFGPVMAACIAGHHAGLSDGPALKRRLDAAAYPLNDASRWSEFVDAPVMADLRPTRAIVVPNRKRFGGLVEPETSRRAFTFAFLTRMVFSCLVDADFLATEAFMSEGAVLRGSKADLPDLTARLSAFLDRKEREAEATGVNALRAEIRRHAVAKASLDPGLFTLSVPTGGGKTLTSLAFSLDHARLKEKRRVVFVIPFTAIAEQTAEVIRQALGDPSLVLEHHANFDWEEMERRVEGDGGDERDGLGPLRLAAENWDAPVVVTTAVQFFESLFANRTSRCRKLHNLVGSVIILDEAQTLPTKLLLPCLAAIEELATNYGASVVLCTATQPAVRAIDGALRSRDLPIDHGLDICESRELAPRPKELAEELRRTRVEVREGPTSDEVIAERFGQQERMLCIVNSRAHARDLFGLIRNLKGTVHLTTLMCPAHRREVLAELKGKLQDKLCREPVRLIATSLIEAGVDISFPEVWRAEAGLDSIAQAAGRCNREGELLPELGRVVVFSPAEHKPPRALRSFQEAAAPVLRDHVDDPLGPDAIRAYFSQLYFQKGIGELDGVAVDGQKGFMAAFAARGGGSGFPFESVAKAFRMIDETMQPVVVPWNDDAKKALGIVEHAQKPPRDALRRLQLYTVSIPKKACERWLSEGAIRRVRDSFGDALLRFETCGLYDERTGIDLEGAAVREAEDNIF